MFFSILFIHSSRTSLFWWIITAIIWRNCSFISMSPCGCFRFSIVHFVLIHLHDWCCVRLPLLLEDHVVLTLHIIFYWLVSVWSMWPNTYTSFSFIIIIYWQCLCKYLFNMYSRTCEVGNFHALNRFGFATPTYLSAPFYLQAFPLLMISGWYLTI